MPADTKAGDVIIKWNKAKDNGAIITQYTVYQSTLSTSEGGTPRNWIRLHVTTDVSDRKVTVKLDKDKIYEFVVTATNKHGESLKEEEKMKKIKVGGQYYLICHYYFFFQNLHSQTEVVEKTEQKRDIYRNSDLSHIQRKI